MTQFCTTDEHEHGAAERRSGVTPCLATSIAMLGEISCLTRMFLAAVNVVLSRLRLMWVLHDAECTGVRT
jgi:hypothetical protein